MKKTESWQDIQYKTELFSSNQSKFEKTVLLFLFCRQAKIES
jgi:hypothetical protein